MQLRSGRILPQPQNIQIMAAAQQQPNAVHTSPAPVRTPDCFTGEQRSVSIRTWLRDYDKISEANLWSVDRRRQIFKFYDCLDANLTYDEVKTQLVEHFSPIGDSGIYWNMLNARYQNPSETVEKFAESITGLLRNAYPNATEDDLADSKVKYFVYRSLPQFQQILLQRKIENLTFAKAVEISKRHEVALKQISMFPMPTVHSPPPPGMHSVHTGDFQQTSATDKLIAAVDKLTAKISEPSKNPPQSRVVCY